KTFALKRLLEVIRASGETVTVLTPTGKATLRVRQEAEFAEAQTIDMFLYRAGGASVLEDFEGFTAFSASKAPPIENLVIDESSMVDLPHLALLFKMLQRQGLKTVHRVILVGDENQLPPIGLGRPYYDIVTWIKEDGHRRQRSLIHLQTNCRQRFDSTVLDLAQLFVGKNRYYEEILGRLRAGGKISDWLTV